MSKTSQPNESGSALIVVLAMVAVLSVMVAHLMLSSEIAAREAHALATRTRLRYIAESAAERGFWMLLADRRQFQTRNLGVLQPLDLAEEQRWLADGSTNTIKYGDYTAAKVKLLDANRGLDVSGSNPVDQLRSFLLRDTDDFEQIEAVNRFLDVLHDYVHGGEKVTTRLHGKSRADYDAEGWENLPRMGPLQERDELLWIDGLDEIMTMPGQRMSAADFIDTIRLIPPADRRFPEQTKPSFFSSGPLLIRHLAELSGLELLEVEQAREDWQAERGNFFDYLEPGLAARLRRHFAFNESSVVTVVAKATEAAKLIGRQVILTRHLSQFMQPRGNTRVMENWQKVLY